MPQDIRFCIPNTPGSLAKAARALAVQGINISGIGCDIRPGENWGYVHFLVDDAESAVRALGDAGCDVLDIHDVQLIDSENKPGVLADLCEDFAERGENMEVIYLGVDNKLVVGTESMRRPFSGRRASDTGYSEKPSDLDHREKA